MIWFVQVLWHIIHCGLFNAKSSLYIYIYIYTYIWFGLFGFYGISNIVGYLMSNPLYIYIYQIYMIWFVQVLWHINHWGLFNAKSSLYIYIYIRYIWFGLFGFYGISTIVGYLMSNPLYIYIKYIWFGLFRFYGISTIVGYLMPNPLYTYIYIYIRYIWFGLFGFYGISTIVGYLMSNPLYIYISNIYDLVCSGFMAYQPLLVI